MLLVVWGHILGHGQVTSFIYSFHMPLFFFISGLLFNGQKYQSFPNFIIRRVKSLLIPYFIYSVITWIVWFAYNYIAKVHVKSFFMPLMQTFIAQGSGGFLVHNVPLWFVTCLFLTELFYYYIAKLPGYGSFLVSLLMSVLGYLMIEKFTFWNFKLLPWNLEVSFAAMIFYCLGNIVRTKIGITKFNDFFVNPKASHSNYYVYIISILCLCVGILGVRINGKISYGSDSLGDHFFWLQISALCGIFVMLHLSCLTALLSNKFSVGILNYLKWIGENSFKFMAVHVPIKGFIIVLIGKLIHRSPSYVGNHYLPSFISFVITMIIVTGITYLTNLMPKSAFNRRESIAK